MIFENNIHGYMYKSLEKNYYIDTFSPANLK